MTTKQTILLIGSGRLARHLKHWSELNQLTHILSWDRHQDPHLLIRQLLEATHVWLAISDDAIVPFYEQNLHGFDFKVVHFSGSLHDKRMISAHPMMSFPKQILPDKIYSQVYFGLTGAKTLSDALPNFKNQFFIISPEQKPLYHALCVTSGNFPQLLWSESQKLFRTLNVPEMAQHTYLNQITQNFLDLGADAVTGPLVRNDQKTIDANLNALADTKLEPIYKIFKKEFSK